MLDRATVSSEGLTKGGFSFRLTHMVVSRFSFSWATGLRAHCCPGASLYPLLHGALHRSTHGIAVGFLQNKQASKQARKSEQDETHSLSIPNLKSDIPFQGASLEVTYPQILKMFLAITSISI